MIKSVSISFFLLIFSSFIFADNNSRYEEFEIILKTKTGNIYGTLTIAKKPKISPIAIIIAGSGPTDRNGNSTLNVNTDSYKMLAQKMAENGISSLRYDKRGIGKSVLAFTRESELTFDIYVDDAVEWIKLLKSDKRFSKVIIIGHSEGSLIGIIAAKQTNPDGIISLAGAGRCADKIILEQINNNNPKIVPEVKNILDSLLQGKMVDSIRPVLKSLFRKSVQPYMISWLKYDPATEINGLKIPVLIIQGSTDIQISVEDANLLAKSAAISNSKVKIVIIKNMNHILKEVDEDLKKNLATYKNPGLPLKNELTVEIVKFVNQISDSK